MFRLEKRIYELESEVNYWKGKQIMEIKTMSQNGLNMLIREEGIVLKPYLCSANTPTIGVGCTFYEDGRKVKLTDPAITKERASELLKLVLKGFEQKVAQVTRDDINQNQFDTLVMIRL